jgi:RNA recognition motif-containing protein
MRVMRRDRERDMSNRLYIGNLSFHTSEDTLRDAFGHFGEVTDVRILSDRESGRSRGFGFVTMADPRNASQAMSQLNGATIDGRDLRVNEAEERQQREGVGGGGRGGFGGGGRGRSF